MSKCKTILQALSYDYRMHSFTLWGVRKFQVPKKLLQRIIGSEKGKINRTAI